MLTSLIREVPKLEWAAAQSMVVSLTPLTLPTGRTLDDFDGYTLTIREDPGWPRATAVARDAANSADPLGDGWAVAVTAVGEVNDGVVQFSFVTPEGAGSRRYAVDVWGSLVAGGEVQLVKSTWLTVLPRVVALPA